MPQASHLKCEQPLGHEFLVTVTSAFRNPPLIAAGSHAHIALVTDEQIPVGFTGNGAHPHLPDAAGVLH